ncbi:MAG: allophanate hydrolase subunit 1 [Pseudomonadota bacterium]
MTSPHWRLVADDLCCITADRNAAALAEALAEAFGDSGEWLDVVCGRDTVFVQFDPSKIDQHGALERLRSFGRSTAGHGGSADCMMIPACYHASVAPDLLATCELLGVSLDEFIERHSGGDHRVAMLGFMPGFAYIDGLDASLRVSRLDQPRQQVAAGAIGLAGRQTGIYPSIGPGGWRLVARTPLRLFDVTAAPPALLQPMQRVRFVPITLDEFETAR